jgi:hypothetical protein
MTAQQINRLSAKVIIVLSVSALLTVLSGYTYPPQPPEPDEGSCQLWPWRSQSWFFSVPRTGSSPCEACVH